MAITTNIIITQTVTLKKQQRCTVSSGGPVKYTLRNTPSASYPLKLVTEVFYQKHSPS
jgi:hypothetical protein